MPMRYEGLAPGQWRRFYACFVPGQPTARADGTYLTKKYSWAFPTLKECVRNVVYRWRGSLPDPANFCSSVLHGWQLGDPERDGRTTSKYHGYYVSREAVWRPLTGVEDEIHKYQYLAVEDVLSGVAW